MENGLSHLQVNDSDAVNATSSMDGSSSLKLATTVAISTSLVIVMIGVGCCIELQELWSHIRRPCGVLIGVMSQFVILPVCAFALAHVLQLPALEAIGMLIMSCCPGGSTSNMFTMWVNGDVPLSLAMTTVNTLLSAGFLPLNLLIYSRSWTNKYAVIPYLSLLQGFAMMFIPAAIGIAVRRWKPALAKYLIKIGSIAGAISIVVVQLLVYREISGNMSVLQIGSIAGAISIVAAMSLVSLLYPFMYRSSWRIYFAVVTLPVLSFGFGYAAAFLFRLPHFRCRTVALETGIQNFPFCMTLLTLSFSTEEMGQLSLYPLLFGVFVLVDALVVTAVYTCGIAVCPEWSRKSKYTVSHNVAKQAAVGDIEMKESSDNENENENADGENVNKDNIEKF